MKKNKPVKKTVIEKYLLANPLWQNGFKEFMALYGTPSVWMNLLTEDGSRIVRLDRRGNAASVPSAKKNADKTTKTFLAGASEKILCDEAASGPFPKTIKWHDGKTGAVFLVKHFGRIKALIFFASHGRRGETSAPLGVFDHFVGAQVELAYKNFELNNFYETVHPRALALSTIHSVHRVISSSLRLQDLLPRIGRLSAQVLKAQGCSIMLVDGNHEYLIPYFAFGDHARLVHANRVRIGRGVQGKIAENGEYYLSRNAVAAPFIEDDIVGVIALWGKIDRKPFTKIDLEILKSLSEQAVVAIKNARLFEETEQLTLGSIKTINELLELSFGGDRSQLPIFGRIVMEIGREMGLSSRDLLHLDRAILLLDTGALTLSATVLQKKGKLTKKDLAQIRRIPARGANLLRSISSLRPIIPIILHHHERFDGKGYPQGLSGEEIPIGARIVSVVDSFIAMISKRSYRERMTVPQALDEIQSNQKSQFDPKVVQCFMKVIKRKEFFEKLELLAQKGKAFSVR